MTYDAAIDITNEVCPMTYVRVRLALDKLAPGQTLHVTLRGAEPARNIPKSATAQGHTLLSQTTAENGTIQLLLRRAEERSDVRHTPHTPHTPPTP